MIDILTLPQMCKGVADDKCRKHEKSMMAAFARHLSCGFCRQIRLGTRQQDDSEEKMLCYATYGSYGPTCRQSTVEASFVPHTLSRIKARLGTLP